MLLTGTRLIGDDFLDALRDAQHDINPRIGFIENMAGREGSREQERRYRE